MKASISIGFALWLSLANLLFTKAASVGSRASSPSPTRPFTVSAFESPNPIGQGITGYNLTARDGNLYLSPKPNGKLGIALPTAYIGLITQQSRKPSCMSMDMEAHSWYVSSSFISIDKPIATPSRQRQGLWLRLTVHVLGLHKETSRLYRHLQRPLSVC